ATQGRAIGQLRAQGEHPATAGEAAQEEVGRNRAAPGRGLDHLAAVVGVELDVADQLRLAGPVPATGTEGGHGPTPPARAASPAARRRRPMDPFRAGGGGGARAETGRAPV